MTQTWKWINEGVAQMTEVKEEENVVNYNRDEVVAQIARLQAILSSIDALPAFEAETP